VLLSSITDDADNSLNESSTAALTHYVRNKIEQAPNFEKNIDYTVYDEQKSFQIH
jgi:hypothetical protein